MILNSPKLLVPAQANAVETAPNSLFYGCEDQVKQVYPRQMDGQPGISLRTGRTVIDGSITSTSYLCPRSTAFPAAGFNATCLIAQEWEVSVCGLTILVLYPVDSLQLQEHSVLQKIMGMLLLKCYSNILKQLEGHSKNVWWTSNYNVPWMIYR